MSFSSNELLNGILTDNRESRDRATKIDDIKDHIGNHFKKTLPTNAIDYLDSGLVSLNFFVPYRVPTLAKASQLREPQ